MNLVWLGAFLMASSFAFGACGFQPVEVPIPTPEAVRFYHSGNILWIINTAWQLVLPALILLTRFSAKIGQLARFLGRKSFFTFIIYTTFYLVLVSLLTFPLDYYAGYMRLHDFGLSNQSFIRWLSHHLMQNILMTFSSLLVLGILYFLIAKSPKRWWLYMGLLIIPLQLFFQVIQPIWVDPLFNDFGPMKNKQLEKRILSLAEKGGIENSRVYEVDKSADTKAMNAYVTGLGNSKRIVLWDTTIKEMSPDELLFIVGHEMGHYVLHHIWWGIFYSSILTLAILFLIYASAHFFLRRYAHLFGFSTLKNPASLPLILILYTFFSLLFLPVQNFLSRIAEHQADQFALEITHLNRAAGTGFLKLMDQNLGYPWPGEWHMLFRASHPSIGSRITFFNTYHPWCEGEPSKYEKYFKTDAQSPSRDIIKQNTSLGQ